MPEAHDVSANTFLINRECLHGGLHSIETGRLPDKVYREIEREVRWNIFILAKLKSNFIGDVYRPRQERNVTRGMRVIDN